MDVLSGDSSNGFIILDIYLFTEKRRVGIPMIWGMIGCFSLVACFLVFGEAVLYYLKREENGKL